MGKAVSHRLLALLLTLAASSCFFLFLYQADNKYQNSDAQAIGGMLYLSREDWTKTPLRYLRDGWRFYPDRLLTPQTLKAQGDDYQYLSIGQVSNLALGSARRSPHGSASYAMTLSLPAEEHTYAIELPEVYSAYRFYINDKQVLSLGDPDPASYRDQTQVRTITFDGAGDVTLLLAVSDFSWVYSGMVYPPAFGEPLQVNTVRGVRMGLCLILLTVTAMLALLAFYLALRTRSRRELWLFFLLCLASALFVSYSVVHGILPLPIRPWYAVELCSGYLVTLLVLLLQGRICDIPFRVRRLCGILAGSVCALALVYGLCAPQLTLPVMRTFSGLVLAVKLCTTAYLLATAAWAVRRKTERAALLLYADLVYACAFAWDRLLPNYEPILGGWFQEWGSIALVVSIGVVLWQQVVNGYRHSLTYAEEQRQMERQLDMQMEHLRQMNRKVEESSKLRHDFRHHLRTLMNLSEAGRREELEAYIRGITEINEGVRMGRLADNPALDALAQYYCNLAQSYGVAFRARLLLPAEFPFPMVELCGLLGNLLENAVEACRRQRTGEKTIFFAGRMQNDQLEFVLDNSFDGPLRTQNGRYLSSKRAGFGLGISSVLETVSRHRGVINLYADDKGFHAELSLPIQPQPPSAAKLPPL